jgi:hypothetical protein|tara:strand:+ start:407 stop:613 length:207 start_codon:yes stop_codon:yes gene_type:complete
LAKANAMSESSSGQNQCISSIAHMKPVTRESELCPYQGFVVKVSGLIFLPNVPVFVQDLPFPLRMFSE